MSKYDHKKIEKKWQEKWDKEKLYKTSPNPKHKQYVLDMFPYISGAGLHVGHPEGYTATDIISRYLRMNGIDVLHPMGWDAFGLPTENFAIKSGIPPWESTKKYADRFREQIKSIGFSYDWEREINTSDPEYYKWTQWLFLQLYKHGLAYKKEAYVNWCPKDQTVLANEQVIDGKCERDGTPVVQKLLLQWFFKITDFAERLLSDVEKLDWPEPIKLMQKNWIGKSEGAEIDFELALGDDVKNLDFVFLHAFKDTHKDAFWPWLKKHLEDRGAKVYAPDLPNPDKPNIEQQVDYVLANHKFRKTTVVITHSLGGVLAMKLLPHLPGQIKHLIMAAPPLRTEFLDGKKREELKDCCDWKFDFKAIKSNAEKITVIRDSKDNIVPPGQPEEIAENLSANLINVEAKSPHFNGTEEPAVLEIAVPKIKIFTTRPDTLFGATYMVLAPEHPLVVEITTADKKQEVQKYIETTKAKTELQRTALEKDKTGVFTGAFAVNPATNEKIPVWIADYVLMNYGTGAIMAVPAHDERDFAFAKKYVLPTLQVITPKANCIILHGCPSSNENDPAKRTYDKHWIPWTKAELEKRGIKTFTPLMPNPWNPVYADWKAEFEKLPVNESTILVGHSCAAAFLTKWLGETKRPVGKLIFVGGARIARQGDHRKDELYLGEISSDIKNKVKDVRLLISNDDPRHIEATKIYAKELNGRIIEVPSRGHFTFKDMGTNELPELLREILGTGKVTTDYGILINSGKFDGLTSEKAKWEITKAVGGQRKIQYKLRDWLVSRQRYWGAPIPIIYCEKCGMQAVPEKDLPVKLPTDVDFKPTGESPLARSKEFHKVKCPNCNEPARRDSDTMDTFVDSSWYFLRFADPHNNKAFSDKKEIKKWLPVDLYVGGAEHAVLHLLYARFITKALADFKLLNFQEPFLKLRNQGLILGPDGEKMSKSRGNVINPDDVIEEFGADSLRLYELFMGPLEDAKPWSTRGIIGVRRFLDRVWNFQEEFKQGEPVRAIHGLTKKVSSDVETFKFNTAIAAFMEFLNENPAMSRENWETFLKLLAPFAPHITEELWENLGHKKSIHLEHWPKFEEKLAQDENVTIVVQVLGRVRATMQMPRDMAREDIKQKALNDPNVKKHLEGKEIVKEIFVKDKLINFVVK